MILGKIYLLFVLFWQLLETKASLPLYSTKIHVTATLKQPVSGFHDGLQWESWKPSTNLRSPSGSWKLPSNLFKVGVFPCDRFVCLTPQKNGETPIYSCLLSVGTFNLLLFFLVETRGRWSVFFHSQMLQFLVSSVGLYGSRGLHGTNPWWPMTC